MYCCSGLVSDGPPRSWFWHVTCWLSDVGHGLGEIPQAFGDGVLGGLVIAPTLLAL